MKRILISFLFCCVIVLDTNFLIAQQKTDSIKYYTDLAENANTKYDANKSFKFFDEQLKRHRATNNTLAEASILISIAQIEMNLGMLNESEGTAVEAIQLLDKLTDDSIQDSYRLSLYNHLGILYRENDNFKTSLEYYERALALAKDSLYKATAINNLANVYRDKKEFYTAINLYEDSHSISVKINNKIQRARALNNLGKTQSMMNNPDAIDNLNEALLLRKEANFDKGVVSSYVSLAEHYRRNKNFLKALEFLEKALLISNSHNRIKEKLEIFELQCDLGYFKNYTKFKALNDSINDARKLSANLYAAIKYDNQKAIDRANKNELEREKEKTGKITSQALGLIILLSSIFLYFFLKSKHKKDKLQQVFTAESRISKKVHDEVANDVFQFMTKLQSEPNSNEELIDDLEEIYNKTRDISKEHSVIDLKGDFKDVLSDLILSFNNSETNVIAKGISDVNWEVISEIKRTTIYKVLQELLINMKKHSQASIVVVTFNTNRKAIQINYKDNGIGCDLKKGSGLQNVENRMASINGTITFESKIDKGFKVKLAV